MTDDDSHGRPVPTGRTQRLLRMGGLASGIAGSVLINGARGLASGQRPSLRDLVLTSANASRLTDHLAQLRGAAMKVGQLLSMDAGEFVPPELADILARLRAEAEPMPARQLRGVLEDAWGRGWRDKFSRFDVVPVAAASIGQVHRVQTNDGRDLALKIQYPGIRQSIYSDVDNVAALIRVTGLLPPALDIVPILAEAKRQLHFEADYERELTFLTRFHNLLRGDPHFQVPAPAPDYSTSDILAMQYLPGTALENCTSLPQSARDMIAGRMCDLVMRELFEFGIMQTDPNFANYRWSSGEERIVLLDFGAAQDVPADTQDGYRAFLSAGARGDRDGAFRAAKRLGILDDKMEPPQRHLTERAIDLTLAPLSQKEAFDFASFSVTPEIRDEAWSLARSRALTYSPPPSLMFIQRKIGGMYLLAARLKARVPLHELLVARLGLAA